MRRASAGRLVVLLALAAIAGAQEQAPEQAEEKDKAPALDAPLLDGLELRSIGPAFMSGRISDIAVDSVAPNTWYVAAGSGNVWKTTNAGTTFEPIFDKYGSYSIGCVAIDPGNRVIRPFAQPNSLGDILKVVTQTYPSTSMIVTTRLPAQGLQFKGQLVDHLPASVMGSLRSSNDTSFSAPFASRSFHNDCGRPTARRIQPRR